MYTIKLYHNFEDFLINLKSFDVSSNPYQRYSFYKVFLKYFKYKQFCFFNMYDDQNMLIGIIPMECTFESSLFRVRSLRFVGYREFNYEQYICEDGRAAEVHEAFMEYLKKDKMATVINYYDINDSSELYLILENEKLCIGSNSLYNCPIVNLSGNFDDFFKKLFISSKKRAELNKFHRRLLESGKIELINVYNDETYNKYKHYIKDIYRIHKERFVGVYSTSFFSADNKRAYYDELLDSILKSGDAYLSMIVLDSVVIAFILCLANKTTLIDWIPAFDPAFAKYNLGTVQYKMLFEQLCQEQKFKYFDYSKGSSTYKRKWAKVETTNFQFTLRVRKTLSSFFVSTYVKAFFDFKSYLREKGVLAKIKKILGTLKNERYITEMAGTQIRMKEIPFTDKLKRCTYSSLVKVPADDRKLILDAIYNGYLVIDIVTKDNKTIIYITKK